MPLPAPSPEGASWSEPVHRSAEASRHAAETPHGALAATHPVVSVRAGRVTGATHATAASCITSVPSAASV